MPPGKAFLRNWPVRIQTQYLCVTSDAYSRTLNKISAVDPCTSVSTHVTKLTGPHFSIEASYPLGSLYWHSPSIPGWDLFRGLPTFSILPQHCDNCHLCYCDLIHPGWMCAVEWLDGLWENRDESTLWVRGTESVCYGENSNLVYGQRQTMSIPFTMLLLHISLDQSF